MKPDNERRRQRSRRLGQVGGHLIRWYSQTLEVRVVDESGFIESPPPHPLIHAMWHDSIFGLAVAFERFFPGRTGAVLTSASTDGEVIASMAEFFGIGAVRGSSSRRGATALIEMKRWLRKGEDIAITPDGPRGPRREIQPGLLILAQKTGAPILPYRFIYHRAWRLRSWDRFQIPWPYSRVELCLGPYLEVAQTGDEDAFLREKARVEEALGRVEDPDT